jgi:hypothetical protein
VVFMGLVLHEMVFAREKKRWDPGVSSTRTSTVRRGGLSTRYPSNDLRNYLTTLDLETGTRPFGNSNHRTD